MIGKHRCEKKIWDYWRHVQCKHNGTVQEDGKWYCKTHAPSRVKYRNEKRMAKWQAEWDARARAREESHQRQAYAEQCAEVVKRYACAGESPEQTLQRIYLAASKAQAQRDELLKALKEIELHLYNQQDLARCRAMAADAIMRSESGVA